MDDKQKFRSGPPVHVGADGREYEVPPKEYGEIQAALARADELARGGDTRYQGRMIGFPELHSPAAADPGAVLASDAEHTELQLKLAAADAYANRGNTRLYGYTVWSDSTRRMVLPDAAKEKPGPKVKEQTLAIIKALNEGEHPGDIAFRFGVTPENVYTIKSRHVTKKGKS